MTEPVLELRGASRTHGTGVRAVTALSAVDLTLRAGEFVAVMGPSGSGKSTLLHLAGGLDSPTAGSVLVEGTDLAGLSPTRLALLRRRRVGYVFQDFNLLPSLTAAENVAFPLELDGHPARRARRAAVAALADMSLAEVADRRPDELSGGQAQRVAIARALLADAPVLLLDEATAFADPESESRIQAALSRLAQGRTVLVIAHRESSMRGADQIVRLERGRVVDVTVAQGVSA